MSHYCVLVIGDAPEEQLAKFDENLEMEEYVRGEVSDYDKARFIQEYSTIDGNLDEVFYDDLSKTLDLDFSENKPVSDTPDGWEKFYARVRYKYSDNYGEWFKEHYPSLFGQFDELYEKNGEDWNFNAWRKNEEGVWVELSRYNTDSRWDWYQIGGRFRGRLKLRVPDDKAPLYDGWQYEKDNDYKKLKKDGYCDQAYVKDIANLNEITTFVVVKDGEWYEKGEMGWFGIVKNEKVEEQWDTEVRQLLNGLDGDELITVVDCHI